MARTRLKWLRAGLLAVFLASAGGIVYLLGFSGTETVEESAPQPAAREGEESTQQDDDDLDFQVRSKNFRQSYAQGDRVLFELAAEEYTVSRDQTVALKVVTVSLPRSEGRYDISSNKGTFDEERSEALLEGDVLVQGPQPFKLWADWLQLKNQGQVIVVSEDSRFQFGTLAEGTAKTLRMDLRNQTMLMNRGVNIHSLPGSATPFSLDAQLLRFVDEKRLIRTEGGARLEQGQSLLQALRISVYLDEFNDSIRFVRGLWNVHGTFAAGKNAEDGAETTFVDYQAMSFALQINERGETEAFELSGTRRSPVTMTTRSKDGVRRTIRGGQLLGSFLNDRLNVVEGVNRVVIEEHGIPASQPEQSQVAENSDRPAGTEIVRSARGESASVSFDQAGDIVRVDLEGKVVISDPRISATAERANLLVLQETIELFGDPLVQLTTAEGLLRAPRAKVNQRLGILETSGGTRARLDGSQTLGAAVALGGGGENDEPVYVESQESLFRQLDGGFLFKGDVRVWQGKNLLLCDQLRGEQDGNDLSASGNVRTVWYAAPSDPAGDATNETGSVEEPVEIRAGFMEYLQADGQLKYDEDVTLRQASGIMHCASLRVELDDQDDVETMFCFGGKKRASLIDEDLGRRILGDQMTYYPKLDKLEVEGKVEAEEGGRKFSGGTLLYDLATGSFSAGQLESAPPGTFG